MNTKTLLAAFAVMVLGGPLAIAATEIPGADKPVDWADPATGYHYMYLPTPRTFHHASLACANRGWSLFNLEYMSKEEQARFYQSPVYAALPWTLRFAGEPGEIQESGFWNSSTNFDASSSATATRYKKMKIDGKVRTEIVYLSTGKPDEGVKLTTICMYRGESWYSCQATQKCTLYGWQNHPGHAPTEFPYGTFDASYGEQGASEAEAWQRIVKRAEYKTPREHKIHKVCIVDKETFSCNKEH